MRLTYLIVLLLLVAVLVTVGITAYQKQIETVTQQACANYKAAGADDPECEVQK